jgi:hypothetical protein
MTLNLDIRQPAAFDGISGDSSDADPQLAGKLIRRSEFLAAMQRAVPWADPVASIERDAPQARKEMAPLALACLLRIDFMQQWFGLSDRSMAGPLTAAVRAAFSASLRLRSGML